MKTTVKALALILAFLSSAVAGITLVNLAKANPMAGTKPLYAMVSIQSPQNTSSNDNTTAPFGSSVQLSFTVKTNLFSESSYSAGDCFIVLDSKSVAFNGFRVMGGMTITDDNGYNPYTQWTLTGEGSISNLAMGTHALEVEYGFYYAWPNASYRKDYIVLSSAYVLFDVKSDIASGSEPIISMPSQPPASTSNATPAITLPDLPYESPIFKVFSPSPNGTYNSSDVPLNVTVRIFRFIYYPVETLKWLNYSLDGQSAVPMTLILPSNSSPVYDVRGNDMLAGLSDGEHNLTVYVETMVSGLTHNFNETVSFTVDASAATTANGFPTSIVAVASAGFAVVVVGTGLLVYFKKRKRKA